jgi:apolipoprotein N-acyltransferase
MAQYRAIETGKPVIRGTNNGVSAIIDHRGRPIATSAQFREEVISSNVQPHTGETPLIHTSPWLMWVFGALFLQGLFLRRRGNRAHPD